MVFTSRTLYSSFCLFETKKKKQTYQELNSLPQYEDSSSMMSSVFDPIIKTNAFAPRMTIRNLKSNWSLLYRSLLVVMHWSELRQWLRVVVTQV